MRLDASQEAHFGIEINPYPFPSQMPSRHKDPVVQLLSHVRLFMTQRTAACQATPSFTIPQSLLKLMSIESVMPSNDLILCLPLLVLPSIFPSIRVFSNESALQISLLRTVRESDQAILLSVAQLESTVFTGSLLRFSSPSLLLFSC